MSKVAVCIPSIGKSGEMLDDLIEVCRAERSVVHISVYDNSAEGVVPYALHRPGKTIYQEFNEFGAHWNHGTHMAFLNDDIVMAPGTLDALATELDGNVDLGLISVDRDNENSRCEPRRVRRTTGTVRLGGINSWVFVVKLGCWRAIDERFQYWCGDDDLVYKLERGGKRVATLEGVSAKHLWSHTLNSVPGVGEATADDMRLWHSMGHP